jgi:alkanesulfonate monooxygenase SsuD/methylene tetrahydromethanopterin reductase-like flavin-dependent oxidoreductase (luciferase family)
MYVGVALTKEGLKLFKEFSDQVPDEVAIEFSIVGTPEDCANEVEEFVKAGGEALSLGQPRTRPQVRPRRLYQKDSSLLEKLT